MEWGVEKCEESIKATEVFICVRLRQADERDQSGKPNRGYGAHLTPLSTARQGSAGGSVAKTGIRNIIHSQALLTTGIG